MIDHVSIPVSDLGRSAAFYDALLAPLGMQRIAERPRTIGFGKRYPELWLNLREGTTQPEGSGHHVCLRALTVRPCTRSAAHWVLASCRLRGRR